MQAVKECQLTYATVHLFAPKKFFFLYTAKKKTVPFPFFHIGGCNSETGQRAGGGSVGQRRAGKGGSRVFVLGGEFQDSSSPFLCLLP